jgi:N-acetylglucosamine kinase-like BadF-type ATPase
MTHIRYFLGIDGGGSTSRARLEDAHGGKESGVNWRSGRTLLGNIAQRTD